jgi:hypothetical protein
MGVRRRAFGAGMTPAEVAELSTQIEVGALRGYYDAVTAGTRRFVPEEFDFETWTSRSTRRRGWRGPRRPPARAPPRGGSAR